MNVNTTWVKPHMLFSLSAMILLLSMVTMGWSGTVYGQADKNISDQDITQAISEHLIDDSAVDANRIDVSTYEGIVTLSGTVNNLLARDRAVRLVESMRGVRSVVNNIEVTVPNRSDSKIRQDINDALLYNKATESFEIDVSVNDMTATLSGQVDSWQEKLLAEKVAKGVKGVKDIENNIDVEYDTDRTDSDIKADIERMLRWDTLVDHTLIDVNVSDGTVKLSGIVGSAAEKRKARYGAWVAGVEDVNADELSVQRWTRDKDLRRNKYVSKSDSEIENAVNDALLYDPRVNSFNVDVSADGGTVTLTGKLDSIQSQRAAVQDARNTVGVWRVKNLVQVRAEDIDDTRIERNIENALQRDPYVDRYDIIVSVVNGEAYLSGMVDSYFEKVRADNIASSAYGVTGINNNLYVSDTRDVLTYDPYIDDYYIYGYDWYTYPDLSTTRADWEIREDIKDELWWSPFVDEDEVTITVENGTATLTGTVDTWSERQAATENALEGGAIAVDNDLMVDFGPDAYNNQ